jgi:hypothetical protein
MIVNRLDYGSMNRAEKTSQGYLKAPCFATRAGIFLYKNDDGSIRREFRPPEEVFNPESLKTLQGIPVTDNHPPVMLDALNTKEYARGFTGDLVEKSDNLVAVPVTITESNLIGAVESREKTETSCGYACELEETSGEWNGQKYDAIQRNIRYNHLAVVNKGRAGSQVRIRIDAAVQIDNDLLEEFCMTKLRIDEVDIELSEAAAIAVSTKLKKDAASLEDLSAQLTALQAEVEKLKGEKEGMTLEMDACKTEKDKAIAEKESAKMDSAAIHAAAMERLNLIKIAEKQVPSVKLDSLSNKEIKCEVIKSKKPDFKFDGLSDLFIDGVFEGLSTIVESRVDALGEAIVHSKPVEKIDARTASMNADRNAWKSNK